MYLFEKEVTFVRRTGFMMLLSKFQLGYSACLQDKSSNVTVNTDFL